MQDSELPNFTVPEHLIAFGKALHPCLAKTKRALNKYSQSSFGSVDGMPGPEEVLNRAQQAVSDISDQINTMTYAILADPDVSIETTYRHVGRFEGHLDSLLDAYTQSAHVDFYGSPKAQQLLTSGLGNIIGQIRDWLQAICDTIDDPLIAYQNRHHDIEDDTAVFTFDLVLQAPPEFEQLGELAQKSARSGGSIWNSVGSIILGFAVIDWFFDDDD